MTDVHTQPAPAILGAAPNSLAYIGSIFTENIHKPLIVTNLNNYTQLYNFVSGIFNRKVLPPGK